MIAESMIETNEKAIKLMSERRKEVSYTQDITNNFFVFLPQSVI
jgi:hypothetical protein